MLAARTGATDTEVHRNGDKLDLHATAAPVAEVLDRLAKQTGMKVSYDGPVPRGRVTLNLTGLTPVQAVVSLLEGQGLNYALRMDPTGTRVETLLLVAPGGSGPGGSASGSGASGPAAPARGQMPPRAMPREPETAEPEEDSPPETAPDPAEERRMTPFQPAMPAGPAMPLTFPPPTVPAAPPSPTPAPPTPQG